jgi:CreA protein
MWRIAVAAVVLVAIAAIGWWLFSGGPRGGLGSVDTNIRWLGPNDKIVVDGFDDPKISGVACHISRPERGGVTGALGVKEEGSEVSISCRQIAPIVFREAIRDGERVFDERRSVIFKTLQVVRFYDRERNVLVYVAYSDRVLTGSAQSSLSSVPLMPWGGVPPRTP